MAKQLKRDEIHVYSERIDIIAFDYYNYSTSDAFDSSFIYCFILHFSSILKILTREAK